MSILLGEKEISIVPLQTGEGSSEQMIGMLQGTMIDLNLEGVESLRDSAFKGFSNLRSVKLPDCAVIGYEAFQNCTNLRVIEFPGDKVCTLRSKNAFSTHSCYLYDDYGGGSGYGEISNGMLSNFEVRVDYKLYDQFMSSGWSDIKGNVVRWIYKSGIWFNKIDKINAKPNQSISFSNLGISLQKADADTQSFTNIPVQINYSIRETGTNAHISNGVLYTGDDENFTVDVSLTYEGVDYSASIPVQVKDVLCVVSNYYGDEYTFVDDGDGYWRSNNSYVEGSYAYCRVDFNFSDYTYVYMTFDNDGESNYDYGIISQFGCELGHSPEEDYDGVMYNFREYGNMYGETYQFEVPPGETFITIKYRKDGSVSNGTDSFRFKFYV